MSAQVSQPTFEAQPNLRKRQAIEISFWAIREILEEQRVAALSELTNAFRTGASYERAAAKLTCLEDISFSFQQNLAMEPQAHAS